MAGFWCQCNPGNDAAGGDAPEGCPAKDAGSPETQSQFLIISAESDFTLTHSSINLVLPLCNSLATCRWIWQAPILGNLPVNCLTTRKTWEVHLHRNCHWLSIRPAYEETPLCSVGKIVRARAFLPFAVGFLQCNWCATWNWLNKLSSDTSSPGDSAFGASTPRNGGMCGRKRWHCLELRNWTPKTLKEKMQWWMSWHSWHFSTIWLFADTWSDQLIQMPWNLMHPSIQKTHNRLWQSNVLISLHAALLHAQDSGIMT